MKQIRALLTLFTAAIPLLILGGCGRQASVDAQEVAAVPTIADLQPFEAERAPVGELSGADLARANAELAARITELEQRLAESAHSDDVGTGVEVERQPTPAVSQWEPATTEPGSTEQRGDSTASAERVEVRLAESSGPVEAPVPDPADERPRTSHVRSWRWFTVSAGEPFEAELLGALSSRDNEAGDPVDLRLTSDLLDGVEVVVPAGSLLAGRVVEARRAPKVGGRGLLGFEITEVELPGGERYDLRSSLWLEGKSRTRKDAITIGGATIGGAVLGRILGKDKGAAAGGVAGAAAGTAVVASGRRGDVELAAGDVVRLALEEPLEVRESSGP
jgi:hypothetical protein